MLVDSHCHLDFPDFDGELDDVVARAGNAGIGYMVTICTKVSEFDRIHAVAEQYGNMSCTIGIHPHNAETEPDTVPQTLVALADTPKVVGIGETGLDFFYDHSPRDIQERQFRAHIAASRQTGLPLVVHTRDADDDTMRILEDETENNGAFPGLIHCFSATRELAERALAIGFYISVSGIVTFKSAEELRQTVSDVPMDRLLVETDSPYLAPVPKRGKRNEPAFTAHTAACVAGLKGVAPEVLAEATTDNFFRLFSKCDRGAATCG